MMKYELSQTEAQQAKRIQMIARDYQNLVKSQSIWDNYDDHKEELESIEEQLREMAGQVGNVIESLTINEGVRKWKKYGEHL